MESKDIDIIAYCCQHCSYAAADLAGSLRMQYPPAIKVVQLPCTGKLDLLMVLHALEKGADGILVVGCLPGDCHYLEGNLNASRRVERIKYLLKQIGLEPERVRMSNVSAAMAGRFVELVQEMTDTVVALGPNPLRNC